VAYPAQGTRRIWSRSCGRGGEDAGGGLRDLGRPQRGGRGDQFGYAVTGLVHPDRVFPNLAARPGDLLAFTKRLGTGVIATALKRGIAGPRHVRSSIASMLELNREACGAMIASGARLHRRERVRADRARAGNGAGQRRHDRDRSQEGTVSAGALEYARQGAIPGGLKNNRDFAGCAVEMARELAPEIENLLYDPRPRAAC